MDGVNGRVWPADKSLYSFVVRFSAILINLLPGNSGISVVQWPQRVHPVASSSVAQAVAVTRSKGAQSQRNATGRIQTPLLHSHRKTL